MGLIQAYRRHVARKNARFSERHLGAVQHMGSAGTISYPYIGYRESGWGAFLEIFSIIAFIVGCGIAFVLLGHAKSVVYVFIALGVLIAGKMLLSELARLVNNAHVRHKIRQNSDYAEYFAVTYPEQVHLCRKLNEIYAASSDAAPAERVQLQMKLEERDDTRIKKVILVLGLGFLFAALIALIAGCIWVKNYLGE
ncbi:MAG: hypothetical protein IKQ39_01735 [Oscillospiraceae bacterium]|nr:hypothetical protein [Oscillospiraceae bacterium]